MMHFTPDAHGIEGQPTGTRFPRQVAVFLRSCVGYDTTRRRFRIYGQPGHVPHLQLSQAHVDDIRNAHTLDDAETVAGRILASQV